ncbi:hypothetical protein A9Q99_24710 [Gammaproteobacteria bacterium 45_16_T64]|nr:hypothetical protein A9Q99_24710 [Gammaproteobacteria bacterium 45_16_T64]
MSGIRDLSIRLKVILVAVIGVVGFLVVMWVNLNYYQETNVKLDSLKEAEYPVLRGAYELQISLADIERTYESSFLESDLDTLNEGRQIVEDTIEGIGELKRIAPHLGERLDLLINNFKTYSDSLDSYTQDFIDGNLDEDIMFEAFEEVSRKRSLYERDLRAFTETLGYDFGDAIQGMQNQGVIAVQREMAVGAVLIVSIVFIAYILVRDILSALNKAVSVADAIAKGNLDIKVSSRRDDETGRLLHALRTMRNRLKEQRLDEEKRANNQMRLSRLNDAMRGELTLEALSNQVLSCMASELNVLVARLFDVEEMKLQYISGYAFEQSNNDKNTYAFGESLVGQCALDREVMVVDQVPENYISISSGVGRAVPKRLIIIPLIHDGKLKGVIELASFAEFDEDMMSYIKSGSEGVAIAMNAAKSRFKLSNMLSKTQAQAAAMENQKEELRVTNEELEEQARELRNSEESLQAQQEELRVMNEELEERTRMLDHQKQEILKKNSELEKSREILVQKTDQLEMSGKYKSEFLSTMSHELRTPLNSILILSQGLINNKSKNLADKEVEHARVIHSSGEDLLSLINDILDLSKVEEGKLELIIDEVPTVEFLSVIKQQFSYEAETKGVALITDVSGAPEMLCLDKHRLNQILRNFLSNAFKFTETGSVTLSISSQDEYLVPTRKGLEPGNYLVIKVTDTGIGIPEEKQQSIFEAFQQADGTTSRQYGGTGLGLTISRELSRIMGGEITVYSGGEGKGSTFALFLPLTPENYHQEPTEIIAVDRNLMEESITSVADEVSLQPLKREERSVLIIEDDENFAKILADLAVDFGLIPWVKHSGEDALLILQEKLPGAIILDLGLPGISGKNVLEILKKSEKTKSIPVHVISGREDSDSILALGATDYLNKPANKNSIQALLKQIKHEATISAKRLLIIEDDPVQQKALNELFSVKDIYFDVIDNGAQAEELLRENDYDCIVMDLRLPDSSGLDVLKKLRSLEKNNHVPAIIYTAMDVSRELEAELRKVADRIILKSGNAMDRLLNETSLFLNWVDSQQIDEREKVIDDGQSDNLEGRHILMVDDDMRNIYSLSAGLEDYGVIISTASTGKEALDFLSKNNTIELILMDIMMPEMDGYEAITRIRAQDKYAKIPIIALTAKAMKEDKSRCIEVGASDYFPKPVDVPKLRSVMKVWLKQKQ